MLIAVIYVFFQMDDSTYRLSYDEGRYTIVPIDRIYVVVSFYHEGILVLRFLFPMQPMIKAIFDADRHHLSTIVSHVQFDKQESGYLQIESVKYPMVYDNNENESGCVMTKSIETIIDSVRLSKPF